MSLSGDKGDQPAGGADQPADPEFQPGRVTWPAQAGKGTASFGVTRAGLARHQAESKPDGIVPSSASGNVDSELSCVLIEGDSGNRLLNKALVLLLGLLGAPGGKSTPCQQAIGSRQLPLGN